MITLNQSMQRFFRDIAKIYGCRLVFKKGHIGGAWYGKYIVVDIKHESLAEAGSLFFHELAHFLNWKEGKYPLYHNPNNFNRMQKLFSSYRKMIRYSLNAEIYTEKRGRALMKQWMPNYKYRDWYKNTRYCYEFLYGLNLRE